MKVLRAVSAVLFAATISGCGGGGSTGALPPATTSAVQTRQMGGASQVGTGLSLTGNVSTVAGNGNVGSADGTGTAATFNSVGGVTTDGHNLYVADLGNRTIRKIVVSTGAVTTLAGASGVTGTADGIGAAARFVAPNGITTDGAALYVTDFYACNIRKINTSTGSVTTIAGTAGSFGSTDGAGTAALFSGPSGITTDGKDLYVVDSTNKTIRKVSIATGAVSTFAGSPGVAGSVDGVGSAARFSTLGDITTDGVNLYVIDNQTVRKIEISTATVTTIAGAPGLTGSLDGTGTAALFNTPYGITTDGKALYISDLGNQTVRKMVLSTGAVTTIAGSPGAIGSTDGIGSAARFQYPSSVTSDGSSLFVVGNFTVRRIQ